MLGALEIKAITRFAAQHAADWKPVHTAVLQGLLAHRNRRTGRCFPERRLLAAHCNVSERTIDRILDQLTAWGAIGRQQPRAVSSQQFRETQYTFLFELPQPVENAENSQGKSCAYHESRATNSGGAVRQIQGEPCDKFGGPIRKEGKEGKDLEGGGSGAAPPDEIFQVVSSPELPQYTQQDFDERDWRKLNRELNRMRADVDGPDDTEERFKIACQRAGISVRRAYELWERMTA